MRIPRYWKRVSQEVERPDGQSYPLSCLGWSDVSVQEAEASAVRKLQTVAERWLREGPSAQQYGYGDRPVREEIVERFGPDPADPVAIITRNGYGSLVLNTSRMMFIDVDVEPDGASGGLFGAVKRLFGAKSAATAHPAEQRIRDWCAKNNGRRLRLYRTFGGYRCAVLDRPIAPDSAEAKDILNALGADELYVRLCNTQACFRARLTPKFWRCGARKPPHRFPLEDAQQERVFNEWKSAYELRCQAFTTCKTVEDFGSSPIHPEISPLLELHDKATGVGRDKPLA